MPGILYLAHRFPYPPNKGDKIRSYHLLKRLASSDPVYLGTFVDDPADWAYRNELNEWCKDAYIAEIRPAWATAFSLTGLLTREALTLPYYRHGGLARWVDRLVEGGLVDRGIAFSSAMAQFMPGRLPVKLMDMVDVDSDKWTQYARTKPWPLSWLYRREAEKLAQWETHVANRFDATFLVSEVEAGLLRTRCPGASGRIYALVNGVDAAYFSPEADQPNPYPKDVVPIAFTGAMNYWPNIDGVTWFVRSVFPRIRAVIPAAVFYIVGRQPTEAVQRLGQAADVKVTGTVPDVRPYLKYASCVVAPLRLGRGTQNKVLEALSMARPVVVTPQATQGIAAKAGEDILVAGEEQSFADDVLGVCTGAHPGLGWRGRQRVLQDHDWERNLTLLDAWL